MQYVRIFADEAGETHFEDLAFELSPLAFAPPAPPLDCSVPLPAASVRFVLFPAGWVGDWHRSPRRQIFFFLRGTVGGQVSDGEERRVGPGGAVLLEDITGKGHRLWTVDGETLAAVVQLAE